MDQLISRISGAVSKVKETCSEQKRRWRGECSKENQKIGVGKDGQLMGVSWNHVREMDLITTAKSKSKRTGRPEYSDPVHKYGIKSERKGTWDKDVKGRGWLKLNTPQTERFQYNMAKANEIELAVEKKSQMMSDRKEVYLTPQEDLNGHVKLNELSSGGKFVFGRSGSKWGKGEHFQDVIGLDFYHGSEGRYFSFSSNFSQSQT